MPSLTSLAQDLVARAQKIDAHLEENNIPYPSFENDTLEDLPPDVQALRWELANASHEFKQLTRGAIMSGWDIAFNVSCTHEREGLSD